MLQNWRITILVTAMAVTSFFAALGSIRLWDEDEPRNAVIGREMHDRGDWVVPTYNDTISLDKPILLYWCMLLTYPFLGVTELAARFPSAMAGAGTIVLTFHLGRFLFDSRTGLLASCLTCSALMFAVLARAATPDSLLIFCIMTSMLSFVAGVASRRGGHFNGNLDHHRSQLTPIHEHGLPVLACAGMYVGIGLAVLAKGPIGVVMPLGIIGSYLLFFDGVDAAPVNSGWLRRVARFFAPRRVIRVVRTLRLGWGVPLVALVALPWYILVALRTNGEWVVGFLGTHNFGRFMHPMEHHHGLPIYYIVAIMAGFFPGSVFLPVSLWSTIGKLRDNGSHRSAAAFLLCWISCFVGFFTLAATKLPNYVVPCYPALAIACGSWLSGIVRQQVARDRLLWIGYGSLVAAGVAISTALAILAKRLLNLDSDLAFPGLVATVGGVACLTLLYRRRIGLSVAVFTVTCLAFTFSATTYTAWRANAAQEGPLLADRIHSLVETPSNVAPRVTTYGYLPPSIVYYLGHHVGRLTDPAQFSAFFDQNGDALLLFRSAYDEFRDRLPPDVTVLAEEQRFLKQQRIVLVGRPTKVARGDAREQAR
jgi:4-amino-4-deoxy-L-arabinose transferase-like glycosyltransferase